MKTNILDTEKGRSAQANLKVILEAIAPYLPRPDVPHVQQQSRWEISDKLEVNGRAISPQKNAMACVS